MNADNRAVPVGSIVYSRRGRDAGKLFITLESDKGYVLIADGMTRKVQKPKRKKVIHIELTTAPVIDITEMTNKKVAAAVKRYMKESCSSELPKG